MKKIKIDQEIEVTEAQYNHLVYVYSGAVASRIEGIWHRKFFVKVWSKRFLPSIQAYLKS